MHVSTVSCCLPLLKVHDVPTVGITNRPARFCVMTPKMPAALMRPRLGRCCHERIVALEREPAVIRHLVARASQILFCNIHEVVLCILQMYNISQLSCGPSFAACKFVVLSLTIGTTGLSCDRFYKHITLILCCCTCSNIKGMTFNLNY